MESPLDTGTHLDTGAHPQTDETVTDAPVIHPATVDYAADPATGQTHSLDNGAAAIESQTISESQTTATQPAALAPPAPQSSNPQSSNTQTDPPQTDPNDPPLPAVTAIQAEFTSAISAYQHLETNHEHLQARHKQVTLDWQRTRAIVQGLVNWNAVPDGGQKFNLLQNLIVDARSKLAIEGKPDPSTA